MSLCTIVYELLIGAISSYLLGNSIFQYSLTVGLFLSAMGLGSFFSKFIRTNLAAKFVAIEVVIGLVGGVSSLALFGIFATSQIYHLFMGLFIVAIGTLAGIEIPLVTRILRGSATLRVLIANVLTWDYVGALAGSLLFPLVLIPQLGLVHSAAAVGLVNVVVGFLVLFVFRDRITGFRGLFVTTVVASVALIVLLVGSGAFTKFLEGRLFQDKVIMREQTQYQQLVFTRYRDDLRLYIDGNLQFSSADEFRYHEALVHVPLAAARVRERILILGGGDGLALRDVLRHVDVKQVTLVDLDPGILRLAREFPPLKRLNSASLDDPRVRVVPGDAFKYLEEYSGEGWNAILADFPDPNNEALGKLYSVEFYRLVKRALAADGVFATQSTSPVLARAAFWSIRKSVEAAGLSVASFHAYVPAFGEWGFQLASPRAVQIPKALAPGISYRYLNDALLPTLFVFATDTGPVDVEPNTLLRPTINSYYRESTRKWLQ
ncbi:MAG: polyamine aminopropyltransferase [Deltaproteobacteria bacterium]|nr:polyamine aminopropyltransferase [Deltaproteobacteria bacterium]